MHPLEASLRPPAHPALRTVRLAGPVDQAGFRHAARTLIREGIPPEGVVWNDGSGATGASEDLFSAAGDAPPERAVAVQREPASPREGSSRLRVPAFFGALCDTALLHAAPERFGLLYRLLWRLQHEPALRHDPLDTDRVTLEHLARAVRRDKHKMTAFVRFRPVGDGWHVAWFEPEHHIVEATAPFFARRFTQMCWAILTPERCARWDGQQLSFAPGASRDQAPPADAGEALWLTYYQHIFNPARLKLGMMQKEMPRRYWHNLPEAVLIHPLAHAAAQRSGQMIEQPAQKPLRRRPAASLALVQPPPEAGLQPYPSPGSPGWAAEGGPPGPAMADASSAADPSALPSSLPALAAAEQACRACPLGQIATQAVPGEGPAQARLMLVGEQPGDQEDLAGRPFVGPAGRLLDRAIEQLGWSRDTLYLTNAVKHFNYELRGKRRLHKSPGQRAMAACRPWLEREIALVRPQALVALGATAAQSLMGRPVAVTRERGQWLPRPDGLQVLVTLHPSALLRMPAEEQEEAFAHWLADLRLAGSFARD